MLIKPNQNGTLSGTLDVIAQARAAGYATIVSARSGETEDAFIADLAVGSAAGQIKIGSLRCSDRWPSTTSCCASRNSAPRRLPA